MELKYLPMNLAAVLSNDNSVLFMLASVVVWLLALLLRKPLGKLCCRALGLSDLSAQHALLTTIDVPLQVLFILLSILPFLSLVPLQVTAGLVSGLVFVAELLAFHVLIQFCYAVVSFWYLLRSKNTRVPKVFLSVILGGLYVAVFLVLLNLVLGINILPFLATSTVITAVLGLSLQDTLRNIFAGLTVTLEQSFRQGDWVLFRQDASNTLVAEVIEIGWRSTKIRTVNNNYIIIPNAQFTNNELINFNSPTPVAAKEIQFQVDLKADAAKVKLAVESAASGVEGVLEKPVPQAFPVSIARDHILFQLRFWYEGYEIRERLTGLVLEAVRKRLLDMQALPAPILPGADR